MAFDVNEDQVKKILGEEETEEISEVQRDYRNYIKYVEKTSAPTYISVNIHREVYDGEELKKIIDTQISELTTSEQIAANLDVSDQDGNINDGTVATNFPSGSPSTINDDE